MSITQGGCGLPFLALPVYNYISSGELAPHFNVPLEYIPNPTVRFIVEKVHVYSIKLCLIFILQVTNAENDAEIQVTCAIDEAQSLLSEAGFFKPLIRLTMDDKSKLSSVLISYHCMTKVKAAMDQLLKAWKVWEFLNTFDLILKSGKCFLWMLVSQLTQVHECMTILTLCFN